MITHDDLVWLKPERLILETSSSDLYVVNSKKF